MKKYSRDDQRTMARWALDCAERVLPIFEVVRPGDVRPDARLRPDASG